MSRALTTGASGRAMQPAVAEQQPVRALVATAGQSKAQISFSFGAFPCECSKVPPHL